MEMYLFLDIDGVLNTDNHLKALKDAGKQLADKNGFYYFDPESVRNLGKIISSSRAKICLISSWSSFGAGTIRELWKDRNLPGTIFKICQPNTSDIANADLCDNGLIKLKSRSIKAFLESRNIPYSYVILDDETGFLPEQESHHVRMDKSVGISEGDVGKALEILTSAVQETKVK